ncbi:MAG: LacI family DNA-binding transcriptional regulator [Clostridia bacterium]|nr:LacI family DNA-binding transcriptional regulator [Clostridia bacterium]
MSATIKDVAKKAGVSIATVSHTINKTRYVSPELAELVNRAIEETGYKVKQSAKNNALVPGKNSVIAFVVPNVTSTVYTKLVSALSRILLESGYLLAVYVTNDNESTERSILSGLMTNKRIAGIILSPISAKSSDYDRLFRSGLPVVCLTRAIDSDRCACITSENKDGMYAAAKHLIRSGHEAICIIIDAGMQSAMKERLEGYRRALEEKNIPFNQKLIMKADINATERDFASAFHKMYDSVRPTAVIAAGNTLTLMLMRALSNLGIDCPRDLSVIGFGDEQWCSFITPPLTVLEQDTEKLAALAARELIREIEGEAPSLGRTDVPIQLSIRRSTMMIGRGPFGEQSHLPSEIVLSHEEKKRLRAGNFKVGISFHYSGNAWTHLHENAIRNTLENFGISVVSVSDAHFDPSLQMTQLEALAMQKPDLIIAIPVDDKVTSDKFRKLSKNTKLVFMSNVPQGLKESEYCTCVSVNESENGANIGNLMGEYFAGRKNVKVGFIMHGVAFYGTHLRDMSAKRELTERYDNIEVAATGKFTSFESAYDVCCDMLREHPDIEGLYVSWDRPALEVIRALKDMGRENISLFTTDLDLEIGKYLGSGQIVKAISSQRPYEQGVAVAMAAAKALVSDNCFKYVALGPYSVKRESLLRAWKEIMHEEAPLPIERALSGSDPLLI